MSEISRSTGSRSSSVDRRAAVLGEQHLVAFAPQHDRQQLAHRPLVVDDEDARARRSVAADSAGLWDRSAHVVTTARAGSRTDTVVPARRAAS